jgi:hypothetical protein
MSNAYDALNNRLGRHHESFFDDNIAVPIVDRLIHHSHIFHVGRGKLSLEAETGKLIARHPKGGSILLANRESIILAIDKGEADRGDRGLEVGYLPAQNRDA